LARLKPGVAAELVRQKLNAISLAFERERAKGFTGMSKQSIDNWLKQTVFLEPASAGVSDLQNDYRRSLAALSVLVALVLLIACANVANLMTAQAAARAREMALRVSIGAGRWRLVQLVLVESAWIAFLGAAIGAFFAWWSAPFVVSRINPPDNPARLFLPTDSRVLGFGLALTLGVTFLFGLAPALRASAVKPGSALKGGDDPRSRRRMMHALIAVQVAYCFLVLSFHHPAVQHHDVPGPADAEHPVVICPVRAGDHRRADARQTCGGPAEGKVDRWDTAAGLRGGTRRKASPY
jgi:hypothetical protein